MSLTRQKLVRGFSLLEISIALAILGIFLYNLSIDTVVFREHDQYSENRLIMEEIRSSLLTYVQITGYLPCPDTDDDGMENRTAGVCADRFGSLPYQELGVASVDVWNQPFYYAINEQTDASGVLNIDDATTSASYFSTTTPPRFNLNTPPTGTSSGGGNYDICGENITNVCDGAAADADKIELSAIAVVVSFGTNGAETWPLVGTAGVAALSNTESENADDDNFFWSAAGSNQQASFFDDQLVWITGYDVKFALYRSERRIN